MLGVGAGVYAVILANRRAYMANMRRAPGVGCVVVWTGLEARWEVGMLGVIGVVGWAWWSGYSLW